MYRYLWPFLCLLMVFAAYQAKAEIDVRTGGYLDFTMGAFDSEFRENFTGEDVSHRDFYVNTEVYVRAVGKEDGWQYGAEVQFQNGPQNSMSIDEAYIFLRSDWGRLTLGDDDGASRHLAVYAPLIEHYGFDQTEGSYALYLLGNPVTMKTINTFDATKITYMSPTMSGFRVGLSYTPEYNEGQDVVTTDVGGSGRFGYRDWVEGGVNYTHKFGDVKLILGATTMTAQSKENLANTDIYEDFWAWQAGAKIEWNEWSFGGGYVDNDDYRRVKGVNYGSDYDFNSWNVGLSYETKTYTLAASYLESEDSVFNDKHQVYGGGFIYKLFPGFQLQGDLIFVDADDATNPGSSAIDFSEDGWVLLLGTHLDF